MKIAVTIATKGGKMSVLYGPDMPFDEQKSRFKALVDDRGGGYEELQIITSVNGRERRKKFGTPPETKKTPPEVNAGESTEVKKRGRPSKND